MGCSASVPVRSSISIRSATSDPDKDLKTSIQDEARDFRSKVSAIKMLTRAEDSYNSIMSYLQEVGKSEYLVCFRDMEDIKHVPDDQLVSRICGLVWRYKAKYEEFKVLDKKPKNSEYLIWECLGKLRNVDSLEKIPLDVVKKLLTIAQNDVIARLIGAFENYLVSKQYKQWQDSQIDAERKRQHASHQQHHTLQHHPSQNSTSIRSNAVVPAPASSVVTASESSIAPSSSFNLHTKSSSVNSISIAPGQSARPATCSNSYPDILIVDDSLVTLKLTKLTLERDGHKVDKAINGQVALDLMKSQTYDVVLIDLNMPVMDGFEAVRLFREHEKENNQIFPSDLSSISDSNDDDPLYASYRRTGAPSQRKSNRNDQEAIVPVSSSAESGVNEEKNNNANVIGLDDRRALKQMDSTFRRTVTPAHYHQLIIGMSMNIDENTRKRALEAGMDHFLPKPFTLQKFIDAIKVSRDDKMRIYTVGGSSTSVKEGESVATTSETGMRAQVSGR